MQGYELVVVILAVVVLALLTANVLLGRKSVEASANQFPPQTTELIKLLLGGAMSLAALTPSKVDDEAIRVIAESAGYKVIVGQDGRLVLERPQPPPAAPSGGA